MKFLVIAVFLLMLANFVPLSHAQDKATFPSDDEIRLLVTQADRAMQQYKPLIDEGERRLGQRGAETVATDRRVVEAVELAVETFKKQPQGFNSPLGFSFFEWLDDVTRNALLCSQTAMSQIALSAMAGKTDDAPQLVQLSQACLDASNLIYTVSENAGSLYARYVKAEEELANGAVTASRKCAEALKRMAPKNQ